MKRQNGTKNKTQQKQEENGSETQHYHLVDWDDAPKYMQINPFIKHGYRPRFSPKLILQSLFRLHNEVIYHNIIERILFLIEKLKDVEYMDTYLCSFCIYILFLSFIKLAFIY